MGTIFTTGTKTCAQCAEEIKAEARLCRFCGAHYDVAHTGYCSTCHARRDVGEDGVQCAVCGQALVDLAVDSAYVEEQAAEPAPAGATAAQTAPEGRLREVAVPSLLQVGARVTAVLAAAGLPVVSIAGFTGETMAMYETSSAERAALGPLYYVLAVLIAVAAAVRLTPWRVDRRYGAAWRENTRPRSLRTAVGRGEVWQGTMLVPRLALHPVLWIATAAATWWLFVDQRPAHATPRPGLTVVAVLVGVGLLASLLMLPLVPMRRLRVDDRGVLFAPDGRALAAVADAEPTPEASRQGRRRPLLVRLVVGVLLGLMVAAAAMYWATTQVDSAAEPQELVDRFGEAGVSCEQTETVLDLETTRSVWCATPDGKAITTTTGAEPVDVEQWVTAECGIVGDMPLSPQAGSVVYGEDWTVDVKRLVKSGDSARAVADALAAVLDGQVRSYDCAKR
jgi:hypothetical protein